MSEENNVAVSTHSEGVCFAVKALPGSQRNQLKGIHDQQLKVAVTAAPEKGKANKAIVALLSKELGIKRSQLSLVSGETSARKQILVKGMTAQELSERIRTALSAASMNP